MIKLYKLVIFSGILTYGALAATFILGITHADIEIHERVAIATLVFASFHAGLVIYGKIRGKMKK